MGTNALQSGFSSFWVVLVAGASVVTTIFWIVVSWRAMRAHERIASTLEQHLPR